MIDHNDYLAACERLRLLDNPRDDDRAKEVYGKTCYLPSNPAVRADKATVYDAEHDQTPATVEWLREVFGKPWYEGIDVTTWQHGGFHIEYHPGGVVRITCGHKIALDDNNFDITNPTRGDVLRLLGVFKERKV